MFQRIAVALDHSPASSRALAKAIDLSKMLALPLRAITVVEQLPAYVAFAAAANPGAIPALTEDRDDFYATLQGQAIAIGSTQGVQVLPSLLEGDPIEAIHGFVNEYDIDLLVLGLHKRSLRMSGIWSTVYTLAQDLPCSMLGVH